MSASGGGGGAGPPKRGAAPFKINIPTFEEAASALQSSQARTTHVPVPPSRPPPTTSSTSSASGGGQPGPSSASAGPRPAPPRYIPRTSSGGGGGAGPSSSGHARPMQGQHSGRPPPPPASSSSSSSAAPSGPPRPLSAPTGRHVIAVSPRQMGNPVLDYVKNVPFEFVEGLVPDYVLGSYTCALYISLRYHLLQPKYLIRRIKELRNDYRLRVILCHVDVEDNVKPLHEINRMALLENCTLILAWSSQEAARYLETYKAYETKPPDSIQERVDSDHGARVSAALTTIRSINKTDAVTLASTFGSVRGIMQASKAELAQCPGLGDIKVQRLFETFHEPFLRKTKAAAPRQTDQYQPTGGASTGAAGVRDDPLEWGSDRDQDDEEEDFV